MRVEQRSRSTEYILVLTQYILGDRIEYSVPNSKVNTEYSDSLVLRTVHRVVVAVGTRLTDYR